MATRQPSPTRHKMTGSTRTELQTPDGLYQIDEREYNVKSPHPRWPDRLVPTTGLNYILAHATDDPSTTRSCYECDECGFYASNARSVIAHFTSHNEYKTEPDYPASTLREIIVTVNEMKAQPGRNFCERAAVALNESGQYHRRDGLPWTADAVSRLYNRWHTDPRFNRRRRTAKKVDALTQPATRQVDVTQVPRQQTPRPTSQSHVLQSTLSDAVLALRDVANRLEGLASTALTLVISQTELSELRAKADAYDEFQAALRRLGVPRQ